MNCFNSFLDHRFDQHDMVLPMRSTSQFKKISSIQFYLIEDPFSLDEIKNLFGIAV